MIDSVTETDAVWAPVPEKFEGGHAGRRRHLRHRRCPRLPGEPRGLRGHPGARDGARALRHEPDGGAAVLSPSSDRFTGDRHHGVISFNVDGIHPHDVASIMDMQQVCIPCGAPLRPAALGMDGL